MGEVDKNSQNDQLTKVLQILAQREVEASQEKVDAKVAKEAGMQQAQVTLRSMNKHQVARENRCNHLKGGWGVEGVVNGEGDRENDSSVGRMRLPNGVTITYCSRCEALRFPTDKDYEKFMKLSRKTQNKPADCNQLRMVYPDPVSEYAYKNKIDSLEIAIDTILADPNATVATKAQAREFKLHPPIFLTEGVNA